MVDMNSHETRKFLTNVFAEWLSSGTMNSWFNALDDNLVWTANGAKKNFDEHDDKQNYTDGKQNYIDNILGNYKKWVKQPPVPKLQLLIVDGNWSTARLRASAETLDGKTLTMDYCWIIRVDNNKVVELIGFYRRPYGKQ
jgi:ketosteroid isomerase-like protein